MDQITAVHVVIVPTSLVHAVEMKNVPRETSEVMHQNWHFSNLDSES